MTSQVYIDLREQLDQYSLGFPPTASGVEIKILQKLFTEEEADMYLNLSMVLEEPEALGKRIGRETEDVAALLERMVDKGLIFRAKKGETFRYAAVPFVVGAYEFQLKRMDREFAELFDRYFVEAFGKQGISVDPPMRTVPVNKAIDYSFPVEPYEDVKAIIRQKDTISVANCVCRVQQGLLEKGCNQPLEACFQFGSHAHYYVDKGMGRFVTTDEALEILDKCEAAGLVAQPFSAQDAGGLCNCCGDCCGVLRAIKLDPKPASRVLTNYYAEVDPEACSACGTCSDRCQMDAITVGSADVAEVDRDRCIGCGLCVTTCPSEALSLRNKPESERRAPAVTARDYLVQLASTRGKSLIPLAITKRSQK
jgi:electron transport complex protein RnfB